MKMAPEDYARELRFKYNACKQDYATLRDNIMEFCSLSAPPVSYKGPKPMDLSPLERRQNEWTTNEWKEYVYDQQNPESELDYLGRPRRNKGGKANGGKCKKI